MENERVNRMHEDLEAIKNRVGEQDAKKLDLEKCQRIVQRLNSFAPNCDICKQHLTDLENHIQQMFIKTEQLADSDMKSHKQKMDQITTHLTNEHKLVTSGLYLSIYMSLGTALGLVFGMLLFDNIALGLPLGIAMGVAIGAGLDQDAKKKGNTL